MIPIMEKKIHDADNYKKGFHMLRLYSKGCEYTLRALICLAARDGGKHMTVRDVCRQARIPEASTRKMLQHLVREGLLRAVSGPGGGYQLRCVPNTVRIFRIITMVDGAHAMDRCVLGLAACNKQSPCTLHATLTRSRSLLLSELKSETLKELCQRAI